MIQCLLSRPSMRRHLDDGAPLSERTQKHLAKCPECSATLNSHQQVIAKLSPPIKQPNAPFLHARIMQAVSAPESEIAESKKVPWIRVALASITGAAILLLATNDPNPKQSQFVKLDLPKFKNATTPALALEQPIQSELENLKADTQNAARALAANFLLSQP